MDREAWQGTVHEIARVRHDLVTKPPPLPGGGDGRPHQHSCLENSKDRGDWQATVHGVTRSWTQLKQLSTAQYTTKEARIYNGEETFSSINVAGKTGQLHAKVSNWTTLLYHAQK